MGILGENRPTCLVDEALGLSFCKSATGVATAIGVFFFGIATGLFVTLCVVLLSNEAAQVMAVWTFPGTNFRAGAVVGLVLCGSAPVAALAWWIHRRRTMMPLVQQIRPADDWLSEDA